MSPRERDSGGGEVTVVDLRAMAADLERHFAGYKQRLADRSGAAPDADDAHHHGGGNDVGGGEEEEGDGGGGEEVRGRMYEAYTRRRDERLREGWRARMERKEAEVKALWARLERRAGAGGDTTADDGGGAAGEKAGDDGGERRRSSDAAAPASRISGKKHARTRSFSSSTMKTTRPDAVARRALSHEPPPPPTSEPPPAAASRRVARVTGGGGATTTEKRRVFSAHRSSAVRDQRGSSAMGGTKPKPKPPRILSNTCSAEAAPPVQSCCSSEQATTVHGETEKASPLPAPFASVSPDSDCGEIVAVGSGEDDRHEPGAEAKEHSAAEGEEVTVSPLPANGNITRDSDTEPRYVYFVKKDVVVDADADAAAMARRSEAVAGDSNSKPELEVEKNNSHEANTTSFAVAESATTIADEAPARESSDESSTTSSFSVTSGTPASCISRAPSIERLLVEDAALLRKKRQETAAGVAEKLALTPKTATATTTLTATTPPARVSGGGAARSPREAVRGFKRFLSFGKKNRGRGGGREVTVIDCTSPSVPSVADDDSSSGGWQSTTDTIKPRMASSDAASDDMDHGHAVSSPQAFSLQSLVAASPAKSELNEIDPQEKSPKAHRSFFSFRSFNCGRS